MPKLSKKEIAIISSIALLFVAGLAAAFVIDAIISQDLIILLSASNSSVRANFGNMTELKFTAQTNPKLLCRAACSYEFADQSQGITIDNGAAEIPSGGTFQKNYTVQTKRRGKGQTIYSYQISCGNIKSFGCVTNGEKHIVTSLVTVNYDYTEHELRLRETLLGNLTGHFKELNVAYADAQSLDSQIQDLEKKTRLGQIKPQRAKLNDEMQKTIIEAESFRTLWNERELGLLESKFSNRTLIPYGDIDALRNGLSYEVEIHNNISSELNSLREKWNGSEFLSIAIEANDTETERRVRAEIVWLNDTIERFASLNYSNHGEMELAAFGGRKSHEFIEEGIMEILGLIFDDAEKIISGNLRSACAVKGYCINSSFERTRESMCNKLESIGKELQNSSYHYARQQFSAPVSGKDAYDSLYKSWNVSKLMNDTEFLMRLSELKENLSMNGSITENKTLRFALNLTTSSSDSEFIRLHCTERPIENLMVTNTSITALSLPEPSVEIIQLDETLGEPQAECCVLGECRPCCTEARCKNDSRTFPVIFVHGHSVNSQNAPEFTADAFGPMQKELQAEGYLNGGIFYSVTASEPGEWGLSGKPVTVSVSYYYDTLRTDYGYELVPRKSQEIQVYAIRMNEIIEQVKNQTGKDKVVIVAHSMGGLVSRSYLQIFGESSVDRLIMIGTPNHGINTTASRICNFLGEDKECEDMTSGSFFLSKLNERTRMTIPVYSIIGIGCATNGADGDGIITAGSAFMEGAQNFYVKGSCSTVKQESLHTQLIHPDRKPEVAAILKEILKNQTG